MKTDPRKAFWHSLPPGPYLQLLAAVFFTFSSIGFITDLWNGGTQPVWQLLALSAYSGAIGVGYAHSVSRNWKLFPVILALHITGSLLLRDASATISVGDAIRDRLVFDGFGILVCIVVGYIFFIVFISGEGMRHLQTRTEMALARDMHDVLVPPIARETGRLSIYGRSNPTSEVGGDLLDVYDTGNELICYMGDVSGHGVGASLLMGMFKTALHTAAKRDGTLESVFNTVNAALHQLRKPSMFLTAAGMRFDESTTASFTIAGHLPILHYRSESGKVERLEIRQIPLSVKPEYVFASRTVEFAPGDCFLFVTDGLTEVARADGEEFGLERMESLFARHGTLPPAELFELIYTEVTKFGPQHDDQTLMIVRCEN